MVVDNPPNRPSDLAPINTLPPELLTRIFYLVLRDFHACVVSGTIGLEIRVAYPKHPQIDILTHICSYWRRVALTSPRLWTHIDIAIDHPLSPSLFERAQVYATRASPLPLDIHIADPASERSRSNPRDFAFLDSTTAAIKSLWFDLSVPIGRFEKYHSDPIEYFLARCQPGVFTEYFTLIRTSLASHIGAFLQPWDMAGERYANDGQIIKIPNTHLENLWLPTRSLRMNGFCPHWSSQAYHGLVDLRIGVGAPRIRAAELLEILRASPELRVFHLKVTLLDDAKRGQCVDLKHLESLSVSVEEWGYNAAYDLALDQFLSMLAPGPNPLQFGYFRPTELRSFAARSNITLLYVEGVALYHLATAVHTFHRLRTLVLGALNCENVDPGTFLNRDQDRGEVLVSETTTNPKVETIYLAGFRRIHFEPLLEAIERYSVQKVVICGGGLAYNEGLETVFIPECDKESIVAKLSTITSCPSVQHYEDNSPLPIDLNDWTLY